MSRVSGSPSGAEYVNPDSRPEGKQYQPASATAVAPARMTAVRRAAWRDTGTATSGWSGTSGHVEVDRLAAGVHLGVQGRLAALSVTGRPPPLVGRGFAF